MEAAGVKQVESRKRRRRRDERVPLQGRLVVEERGKGYTGSISRDLARDLFADTTVGALYHIALAPWQPPTQSLLEDASWTIVPVKVAEADAPLSMIRFPASSSALQAFASALPSSPRVKGGIEVLVVDVQPLPLQTVFVRVDGDALQKHEDVQRRFGGGFQPQANGSIRGSKGKPTDRPRSPPQSLDEELRKAMRAAFTSPSIVHKNDQFTIPLPSHPITHAQFPPVEVVLCEPVDQGIVSADTRIVIDVDSRGKHSFSRYSIRSAKPVSFHDGPAFSSSEDTSTDNFYSATENESATDEKTSDDPVADSSATETETEDETTDDEENAISLSQPALPPQASGVLSSMTAATPRPFGARTNGIASPGSVFSGYTATTARGAGSAKAFEVKPLTKRIPDALLHPPPVSDDDDESRVYVDVKMLVRIGCFSGDWVKLTVAPSPNSKEGLWPMGAFGDDEGEQNCRTVKVFGLAELAAAEAMQRQKTGMVRRGSISSVFAFTRPSPSAYLSPILFSNLGRPTNVTLAPLAAQAGESRVMRSKVPSSATPPLAKEITLLRVPTPAATERSTQAGLFASLKHHFERRRRLLQTGDLVAVTFDASTSRILAEAPAGQEADNDLDELLVGTEAGDANGTPAEVAWFKVGQIVRQQEDPHTSDPALWAEVSTIEPGVTRIAQAGTEPSPAPIPREVPWDLYLGARSRARQNTPSSIPVESLDSIPKPYISQLQRRLRELFAVASSPKAIKLNLQPMVILLHSTQRGIGKATVTSKAAADLGLHFFPIDSYDLVSDGGAGGDVKTEATLRHRIERALQCGAQYTVPLIRHAEALTADRTAAAIKELLEELRVLVLSTTELDKIPESVRSLVTHELEVSAPDEAEREGILSAIIQDRSVRLAPDVDIKAVAVKTAALVAGDLVDVLERASVVRQSRLEKLASNEAQSAAGLLVRDLVVSGGAYARCLTKTDFDTAVEAARKNFADSIGAPKIPNVTWDDVGGLANVKDAVMETIQLPLERPELFAKGMKKRSGILFYGPPGTGKTLLAKAIATEFSLNFFSVKGPELLNMYIGESEANVRRVFQRARDARPCVVFFDELDSVAPKRGNQGDSGGVMDRIVSQLLAELDGMSGGDSGGGVFVIGATNRPDLLDQALLRPGRFDKMLYLSIADTHDKQLAILEALTRKFNLDPSLNLRNVAERLPLLYTGADMYALCSDAMLKAITRKASAVDDKIKTLPDGPVTTAYFFDHLATKDDIEVSVTEADFVAAQSELVGSVSAKELEHYQRVRAQFEAPEGNNSKSTTAATNNNNNNGVPPQKGGSPAHLLPPSAKTSTPRARPAMKTTSSSTGTVKGKGKAPVAAAAAAVAADSDGQDSEDDEDAYVTSNDYSPYRDANGAAGKGKGKAKATGKGKAVADEGFEDAADNDDELYG